MPYISTEEVKVKRNAIKKAFPAKDGWKFSIRVQNYSTISVTIKAAPFQMLDEGSKYEQVNTYYIEEHYNDKPEVKKALLKLHALMNSDNGVLVEDGDYGTVPNFYTSLNIGDWETPFVVNGVKEKRDSKLTSIGI